MKSDSDAAPEVLDDPRAAAKARKRRRARSRVVRLLIAGLTGTVLLGLTALLKISHADYSAARGEVESRETQLRTLQAQQRSGHIRLAALQHEKGRAQSLIEHGYVRPGDRILLFPATPQPTQNGPTKNSAAGETGEAATMGEETAVDTSAVGASASASASSAANSAASGQALTGRAGSGVTSRAAAGLARSSDAPRASDGSDSTRVASSNTAPPAAVRSTESESQSPPPLKPPSAWRRAGQTLQGWWQAIRGAGAAPPQSQN